MKQLKRIAILILALVAATESYPVSGETYYQKSAGNIYSRVDTWSSSTGIYRQALYHVRCTAYEGPGT